MTLTAITLAVLLHGRASEPAIPVMDFTSGAACARAMKPVQEGLRSTGRLP